MVLVKDLSADAKTNVAKRPTLEKIYKSGAINRARFTKVY